MLQVTVLEGGETGDVEVGSLHPNHPGVLQEEVDVLVDVGVIIFELDLLVVVVVVSSLQPNHPGVLHVDVVVVLVLLVVVTGLVVVSSKHPHQPGV